jgi:thiol:disulfide interchange protein DsbC
MISRVCLLLLAVAGATLSYPLRAQQAALAPAAGQSDPRAQIVNKIPGTRIEDLRPTPVQGIYELTQGTGVGYVTSDGRYAFRGDLIDIATKSDLSEQHRRDVRAKLIGAISEDQMVVFGPRDPKFTVTVFTDVDCAYCRELHRQIAEYNRLGIKVRYLLYPRTGPNTESWTKAEQVWCSKDRNDALTQAKRGVELTTKICPNTPVAAHYALGRDFELEGTPAIVMPSGELYAGYLPPAALAQHLQDWQHGH